MDVLVAVFPDGVEWVAALAWHRPDGGAPGEPPGAP